MKGNTKASANAMYRAMVARDIAFDGLFVVGVTTTGIFCRCTCPARKPLRENVEFFADATAAMFAGYRACKRCRPLESLHSRTKSAALTLAARLKSIIDDKPLRRVRDSDLAAIGIDPGTARRQFNRVYGMTFQKYARARRMGQAIKVIRERTTPIKINEAASGSGFASPSGYRDAFDKLFGTNEAETRQAKGRLPGVVFARWIETPIGSMLALADDLGLRLLDFVDRRGIERQIGTIRRVLGCAIVPGDHEYLDAIAHELDHYFEGKRSAISTMGVTGELEALIGGIPIAPIGSGGSIGGGAFQRSVWAALRQVPIGQTRSYSQQAVAIGKPNAVRAVARANGENYIALLIPCHRVIGADGSMTGYGGGVDRKRWLLEHERSMVNRA